jgi:hypothetical protein
MTEKLKYFKIAKQLNEENHLLLIERKLHFRGNFGSISLISIDRKTAEMGIPNIKTKKRGKNFFANYCI